MYGENAWFPSDDGVILVDSTRARNKPQQTTTNHEQCL